MAEKRSQITQSPTGSRLATSTTSSWRGGQLQHEAALVQPGGDLFFALKSHSQNPLQHFPFKPPYKREGFEQIHDGRMIFNDRGSLGCREFGKVPFLVPYFRERSSQFQNGFSMEFPRVLFRFCGEDRVEQFFGGRMAVKPICRMKKLDGNDIARLRKEGLGFWGQ